MKKFLKRSCIFLIGCFLLFLLLNLIFPLPGNIEYSTIIRDNRGELMNAYLTSDQKWRVEASLEEISPLLRKTIVAKEDQYFYSHPGINPFAILRAGFKNIVRMKRTSGASTITMQVARALEPKRRNLINKVVEMFRAFQLEWKYSKEEILQLYLNLVPYGGNIEGVKTASLLYFNKNPDHLSLAEITALSIIPNRPSSLVIGRNNERIVKERNTWLRRFRDDGIFTEKEIEDALSEPLLATRGTFPHHAPQLSGKLRLRGKSLIHSTIDLNMQMKTEKLVADYTRMLKLKNINNAAVVIIDNRTNRIVTYVGSADFRDTANAGQVNGAAAIRQPGSTLKPVLYAMCFDEGLLTPKSVISDVAVNYQGYAPENYDQHFNGYVTTEYALEHSLNIPAVKALRMLGQERLIHTLINAEFRQIARDERKLGLSMILGGCGTTLEELTSLFASFAAGGMYRPPSYAMEDSSRQEKRLFSPAAAYMISDILSRVNRPDFPLNWSATERMPKIAWKTGTSYGRRDGWSIGFNKHFTVGVWTGNFSGLGVPGLSGASIATPLLFRIFNTIDYDTDADWFQQPADCDIRQVCSETGMIPSEHCENITSDLFIPLVSSTQPCNNRRQVMVSENEKISYCQDCAPVSGFKRNWYRVIEPDMQAWFEENRIAYQRIPDHNPDCERIFRGNAPFITSPTNGTEYLISRTDPEPIQLLARTANDVGKVYWYINDKFYKAANPREKQFFIPGEGEVKISCTDDKGRNRDVRIRVRYVRM